MPELRKDPVLGRWVIIATERARRPDDFRTVLQTEPPESPSPFMPGNESMLPPEIYAVRPGGSASNTPGWTVRVVSSIAPIFRVEGELNRRGNGIYDVMNGIGAHEIIVESPDPSASTATFDEPHLAVVLQTYVNRMKSLAGDPRIQYVLISKNYGEAAGEGPHRHPRAQLMATPMIPKRVKEKLAGARQYFEYKERSVYRDVIKQELADGQRVVLDHEDFVVLTPFASRLPFELCLFPKAHACDFHSISGAHINSLAHVLKRTMQLLSVALEDPPYNYMIQTAPIRREKRRGYWNTIEEDFCWHIEIMPRLTRVAGFEWGTGFYINPTSPEEAAKYLRETKLP